MPGEIVILLLGPTQSGKTAFARCATRQKWEGGGSTTDCKEYTARVDDKVFRIIDTPGFDDTPAANLGALGKIAKKLSELGQAEVSGVVYFHRITNTRLTGSARSSIEIFEQICGVSFLSKSRVIFATTMWNTISDEWRKKYELLENELKNKQLKHLASNTVKFPRFNAATESAHDILRYLAKLEAPTDKFRLQLTREIQQSGATPSGVRRTAAGRLIGKGMGRGGFCTIL
ncbi:hypothetical protein B0T16DRAFT_421363 [Cercophora newfieldiana]|uniref:G domain-containing protein n=1 Tax=Cercophora newfieldiana TaxID=92897 RepID=A0AA39XT06_9PEZI|nr:hypothetical protein B0T16DRAFT_421363 [Cercophora newfieldiana]